jgi:hypothetical protein
VKPGTPSGEVGLQCGEVLLGVEVIRKEDEGEAVDWYPLPSEAPGWVCGLNEGLKPITRTAKIEVLMMGLQGLKPLMGMPIRSPFIEVELGQGAHDSWKRCSAEGRVAKHRLDSDEGIFKTSEADVSFNQYFEGDVELPVNPLYIPRLTVRVKDSRIGGLGKQLMGVGEMDLWNSGKMPSPWKSKAYRDLEKGQQLDFGQRHLHYKDAQKVLKNLEPKMGLTPTGRPQHDREELRKRATAKAAVIEALSEGQKQRGEAYARHKQEKAEMEKAAVLSEQRGEPGAGERPRSMSAMSTDSEFEGAEEEHHGCGPKDGVRYSLCA